MSVICVLAGIVLLVSAIKFFVPDREKRRTRPTNYVPPPATRTPPKEVKLVVRLLDGAKDIW